MSFEILYTLRADETLQSICDSIYENFGQLSEDKFILKVEKTIRLISEHPSIFKSSPVDENVRIALVTKQTSVSYRVTETTSTYCFFGITAKTPSLIKPQ